MTMYWGCAISLGVTATDLDAFESLAGKKISMLGIGSTWWNGGIYPTGAYSAFPTTKAQLIHGRGGYMMFDWITGSSYASGGADDPGFNLPNIYNGTHDTYITSVANSIKALGFPILLRIFHEMNGSWYHWYYQADTSIGNGGYNSGQVIRAWKHIVDLFEAAGCTHLGPTPNVRWVFCPNNQTTTSSGSTFENLADFYPGDAYVDWKGFDGYNAASDGVWRELSAVTLGGGTSGLQNTLQNLINLGSNPDMPIGIFETGCHDHDETGAVNAAKKAAWFTNAFGTFLPAHPEIQAIIYSHYNEAPSNWRIDYPSGNTVTVPAFAAANAIGSAHYLPGLQFTFDPLVTPYWLGAPADRYRTLVKSVSGLAGYWRGQEASGNLVDDSGNGHTATAEGTPAYGVASVVVPANTADKALGLAGDALTGFRLLDADVWSPVTTGAMSWSLAFILDAYPATGTNAYFFGKGNATGTQYEYDIYVGATGLLNFALRQLTNDLSADIISTLAVPLGVPCLLQARYDGSTKIMQLVASSAVSGGTWGNVCNKTSTWPYTLSNGTADLLLLRRDRSGEHTITGKAAHLFIATKAVSDISWQELYNTWIAAPVVSGVSVA